MANRMSLFVMENTVQVLSSPNRFETVLRTTEQLSSTLKSLRKQRGWSQSEMGKRLGLSQERISAIENHPQRVPLNQLLSVFMVLDAELVLRSRTAPATQDW